MSAIGLLERAGEAIDRHLAAVRSAREQASAPVIADVVRTRGAVISALTEAVLGIDLLPPPERALVAVVFAYEAMTHRGPQIVAGVVSPDEIETLSLRCAIAARRLRHYNDAADRTIGPTEGEQASWLT